MMPGEHGLSGFVPDRGGMMAVMVTAEVAGQTRQGYDAIRAGLEGPLKSAPGLILHTSHEVEGGWRVIEIWESSK